VDQLILPYAFVKGCPNQCAFCSYPEYNERCEEIRPCWRAKPPREVASDLAHLSRRYGTRYFWFLNPCFNPTYAYASHVADAVIDEGLDIAWTDCAHMGNLDEALIEKMKRMGAMRLILGLESASQRILDYIGKRISVEKTEKMLRYLSERGIESAIELIAGFPHETRADVEATIAFIRRNHSFIGELNVNKFWLAGLMKLHPDEYGIHCRSERDGTHVNWSCREYDEIGGLPWEEKYKQVNEHFELLQDLVREVIRTHSLCFHALILKNQVQDNTAEH